MIMNPPTETSVAPTFRGHAASAADDLQMFAGIDVHHEG